jgi:hypothetical protein
MNPTIEITGVRIRRALVPVRRILNTRVGRFTVRGSHPPSARLRGEGRGEGQLVLCLPL